MFSSSHIVALRKERGFSQEVLAERSGVSLRTIQRVERGETVPRGHTLLALATALDVSLENFQTAPEPPQQPGSSPAAMRTDPQFLQLLNLSALSFLVLPLLNIIVPVLLWRARKADTQDVAEVGRRVIGFQVLWQVSSFFLFLVALVVHLAAAKYYKVVFPFSFLGLLILTYALNVAAICYNGVRLRRGHLDLYSVRF
jgi:transcriptional regulator with XRE-family HTH domain